MNVLLTGGSSFSGLWFAQMLAARGASITAPLRGGIASYQGVRAARVKILGTIAQIVPECSFGNERFMSLVADNVFDAFCHHAARVTDYRSLNFDIMGAVAENTMNLRIVLERMCANGLRAVIATGSVFEQDEGVGNNPLRAFSPYGLSKGLTWQVIRHWCTHLGIPLGKFVIANPFGPFEEPRFGAYLVGCWKKGETAEVRTPRYLRDNIHIDLLALAYARFVSDIIETGRGGRLGPSGYVETQGAFAQRVAAELEPRFGIACRVKLLHQMDLAEPLVRINTDVLDAADFGWTEGSAWDAVARYYLGESR